MEKTIYLSLIIISVLEILFPRNKQPFFKKGFVEDLFYMFMVLFVIEKLNFYIIDGIANLKAFTLYQVKNWPPLLEFISCLLMYDFIRYVFHFLMHKSNRLWHVHKAHHSTAELSALSGFRGGYFEDLGMLLFSIPFVALIGFNAEYIVTCELIFAIHGFFLHSNINFRIPKIFSFIACPYFHGSHHIRNKKFSHVNFGATFTIWDKIFKTFYLPNNLDFSELGLVDENERKTFNSLNYISRYFYFPFWRK